MKKTLIIVSTLVIAFGGIGLGVYLVGQRQSLTGKAAPATSISISPATVTKAPGASFTFNVVMSTGENQVTGVDLRINYNATNVQVDSITKGSGIGVLDQKIRETIDNTAGQISFSYYTLDKTVAVTGSGITVLTIAGKVKDAATAGTYNISFASGTAVIGVAEGQNVLTGSTPAVLTVSGSELATNPTLTPTPTPTGTGTRTPTPTATATSPSGGTAKPKTPTPIPAALPVTGTSWPTIGGAVLGGAVIIFSLFLAF